MKRKLLKIMLFLITTVYALGAITINKGASISEYIPGEVFTYTIRIENNDSVEVRNLTVNDDMSSLPLIEKSVSVDEGIGSSSKTYSFSNKKFNASDVTVGANSYIEYTLKVELDTDANGDITNISKVMGTGISESSNVVVKELDQGTAISLTKTSSTAEYDNGEQIEYKVKLTNSSNKTVKDIKILDDLSSLGFSNVDLVVSTTGIGTNPKISDGNLPDMKIDIPDAIIGPNGSIVYTLIGTVNNTQSFPIVNKAKATIAGIDKVATVTHTRILYDYSIFKSVNKSKYTLGEPLIYTLRLENNKANKVKGLDVTDLLSTIVANTTVGSDGLVFDMSNTTVSANVSSGSHSGLSSNPLNGDLVATSAELAPNGWVEYTISAKINNNIIGEIRNTATIIETTRGNNTKTSNEVVVDPGKANIVVTKKVDKTKDYLPEDSLTYTIKIENNGGGYGEEYIVEDLLSEVKTLLANENTNYFDSTDITSGNPFGIGTIELIYIGDNSSSKNYILGSQQSNKDLTDRVYIAPGEYLKYKIIIPTNPSAIGDINNEVIVTSPSGDSDFPKTANAITTPKKLGEESVVEITKKIGPISQKEYRPGDEITYDILVTNTDSAHFINNFNLKDTITNIETDLLDININSPTYGQTIRGSAFESWTLTTVDPTSSINGTKPGTDIVTDADININLDIAPGESIKYQLKAKIKENAVGKIVDNNINGDNVIENDEGVVMSSLELGIVKTVNKTNYSPNEEMTYEVIIENTGNGYAQNIEVVDLLSEIVSDTGVKAYSSWEVTSKLEGLSPGRPASGHSGIISEPLMSPNNIDPDNPYMKTAQIGPNTKLTYTIKAVINCEATGRIQNKATINGLLVADKGIVSNPSNLTATKTVDVRNYASIDGNDILTYTITLNNVNGGYIEQVDIRDDLTNIEVELLNGNKITDIFSSYTLEIIDSGGCSSTSPSPKGAKVFDGILDETTSLSGNQTIKYIIKATLKKDYPIDHIPYGAIKNTGTVTPKNGSTINIDAITLPRQPNLAIVKSTTNLKFFPGQIVNYDIRVDNNGNGYANDAHVTDVFNNTQFEYWTITTKTDGDKGTSGYRGSNADVNNHIPSGQNTQNIDVLADIKPGGFVEYHIEALVKSTVLPSEMISNLANVHDTQSGNDYSSSVELDGTNDGLYITKVADKFNYIPGEPLGYTITIFNTTNDPIDFKASGYTVSDKFSDIKMDLANDGVNPYVDISAGDPFDEINWTGENGTTGSGDIDDQPTIPANGSYQYNVSTQVSNRVLHGKMENKVFLIDNNNDKFAKASVELNGGGDYGKLTRTVDKQEYIPGQNLTYTIVVKGGRDGYANNIDLLEEISKIQVKLMDGTNGPVFGDINGVTPKYTWTLDVNATNSGTSKPSKPADNTDIINEILDVAPGDMITYTVTGRIRPDANGDISYKGLVTKQHRYNLDIKKTTDKSAYIPGENMSFIIDIENNSNGNAGQIPIRDIISDIKVPLSDGTTGDAFDPLAWTITREKSGDYIDYVDFGITPDNTDIITKFDLPINTKIKYKITAKVNPKAIGNILNTAFIDGDQVGTGIGTARPGLEISKEINKYYDRDGKTEITGGYKPGGYIEYLLTLKNQGDGVINNIPLGDLVSKIKTDRIDGTNLKAFSRWDITESHTGGSVTVPGQGVNYPIINQDLLETPGDGVHMIIDIASKSEIIFKIKAKVDERAIGEIENIATSETSSKKSGISKMKEQDITINKKVLEINGTDKDFDKITYKPGDEVKYVIRVENKGDGISIGKTPSFKDFLEDVVVETPGEPHLSKQAFSSWNVTASKRNSQSITIGDGSNYNDGRDNVTTLGDFKPISNLNIKNNNIFLAPGGWIEYVVTAIIRDDAMTSITNKGTYLSKEKTIHDTAVLRPLAPKMEVEKKIVSVDGVPWTTGMHYKPGGEVIYEIKATNTGESFGNNILVVDTLSSIRSDISGNTTDTAFESWQITEDGGTNDLTFIHSYDKTKDLNVKVDIAPSDTITFNIKAKIRDNLIGTIPGNTVAIKDGTIDLDEDITDVITPNPPKLTYHKEISNNGINYGTADIDYIPSNSLYYKIILENSGLGYGVKVNTKDILKNVIDSKGNSAFSSASTTIKITDKDGNETNSTTDNKTVVSNFQNNINGFNTSIDIEPGAKVEFIVNAKVKNKALGDIKNKATVDGTDTNEVTAHLGKSIIESTKTGSVRYGPGNPITYTLTVENTGSSTAQDIVLNELISKIKVETIGGLEKPAFKPGWSLKTILDDRDGNSDISQIPSSGDIEDIPITLGMGDKVTITIGATVIDDAIGDIANRFTTNYNNKEISEYWEILHSVGDILVTKMPVLDRNSEVSNTDYTPGVEKTFLVEVKNIGKGFALGVDISDKLMEVKTLGGGNFPGDSTHEVDAFRENSGTIPLEVKYRSKNGSLDTRPIGTPNETLGFEGEVNIAPGDTFQIWITSRLNKEAMKEITTDVVVEFNPNPDPTIKSIKTLTATTKIYSVKDDVKIKKEISADGTSYGINKIVYSPGDTIYYRIIADNSTGSGWVDDLKILDEIKEIKADISGGGQGPAFDPATIKITNINTGTPNYSKIDVLDKNLKGIFDLGPGQTMTFDVEATINNNIIGEIDNMATFTKKSTEYDTNVVTAISKDVDLKNLIITKEESIGGSNYSDAPMQYKSGGESYYKITVENKNTSFIHNLKVQDIVGDIMVDSSGIPNYVKAFNSISVKPTINAPSKVVGTPDYTNGIDVTIDLAPNDKVEFIVTSTIIDTAIGEIKNTATTSYNSGAQTKDSNEVIFEPTPAEITIEKTTTTPLAIPGKNIEYEVLIKNKGGLANDLKFIDDLSSIEGLLSDTNLSGQVFESISASVISATGATPKIPVLDTTGNEVNSTFDLKADGEVKIKIIGKLKDTMVYGINADPTDRTIINTATFEFTKNYDELPTIGESKVSVPVANADMKIDKIAMVDPNLGGYIPGDDVEFRIKVINDGNGIGDKFHISDELDKVMVDAIGGIKKLAFSKWTISVEESGKLPTTSLPTFDSAKNLDIDIDVAPGDEVEFKIIATVIPEAFGELTNSATGSYDQDKHNDGTKASDIGDSDSFQPSRSEVHIEKIVDKITFAPGEEITYTIKVWNVGPGPAHKVKFEDILPQALTTSGNGDAFDPATSNVIKVELFNNASENKPLSNIGNAFTSELELPRDGYAIYTIASNVSLDVVGKIDNIAEFSYTDNDGTDKEGTANAESNPANAKLNIIKTVDTSEFVAGKDLTYVVTISNTGLGIANDVKVVDLILDIENESISGNSIKAFDSVVITDNSGSLNPISNIESYDPNKNLDTLVDIAPNDSIIFTLVGTTNKIIGEDITNRADYTFTNNDGNKNTGFAEVSSKIKLNEGILQLSKRALKKDVEKGQVVEYEIIVNNPTDVYFTNVAVEDKTPAGFTYVKDTTEIILSTDGKFGNNDDRDVSDEPIIGNTLGFTAVNIAPKENLRIRYLLRASIGTTFGKYVNTAHAVSGGKVVSNYDSADVEVIPDALFDTATIIGKVFEDINGDGYQADATAKRIKLISSIDPTNYIPNSTTLTIGDKTTKIKDKSSPLVKGITIGKLRGVSRNRKIKEPNKAVIRYETITSTWEPLKVTSKDGTTILIDSNGKAKASHKGDLKEGLARENLKITRNIYAQKGSPNYLQEIVVENFGIYEDGIPGIRLITLGGVVITTDEFGRYHVPDEWVTKKTGSNFLVKVDRDSLPQGMRVISENPRVKRITPNGLNKFNFSIQRELDDFNIKDANKVRKVRGKENG